MNAKEKLSKDIDRAKGQLDVSESRLRTAQSEFDKNESYYFGLRDALRAIEGAEAETLAANGRKDENE